MTIISADLEQKCRKIVHKMLKQESDSTPATFVGREMALLLDQMDSVRQSKEKQANQLKRRELELGTQILNFENRNDLISDWLERTRMITEVKRTLDQINAQTQRLMWESDSAVQRLQGRLLELWNMHDQLGEEYGNT
jgi:hypothetical protein